MRAEDGRMREIPAELDLRAVLFLIPHPSSLIPR
jgi:hypothetical protein